MRTGDGPVRMDRRDFLRLGGTGLAGAALLGVTGGQVWARSQPLLDSEFKVASEEYGVPKDLLLAMGYVNTMWEMPPPSATPYEMGDLHGRGTYGIMQLEQSPTRDSLGRAVSLTGLAEKEIKSERAANVRAGAALLADIQGKKTQDVNGWQESVSEYAGIDLYAQEVYEVLDSGTSATIASGERLSVAPQPGIVIPQFYSTYGSRGDYGRASWRPAYNGNYTNSRRERSYNIDKIVVHVVQGSYSSAVNWFQDPRAGVSAHYTVSKKGKIAQSVRHEDIAYHAGHWGTNKHSIGIEHEGYVDNPSWFTDRMYGASARLAAYAVRRHRIPIDRRHIIGHNQVPGCPGPGGGGSCHTDPGRHWNWDKYLRLIKKHVRRARHRR